jgi:agmatine/peptidylarginine deiminase
MKVSEVIAALSEMPADAEVQCENDDGAGSYLTTTACVLEHGRAVIHFMGYELAYAERD